MTRFFFLLALLFLPPSASLAEDALLHSDLPLWSSSDKAVWPHSVVDEDGIGCIHRIRTGDWSYREPGEEPSGWWRLRNYGVFHCWIMETRAGSREELDTESASPSFLIDLGEAKGAKSRVHLWALQTGARPGSDYTLLSHALGKHVIEAFDILQRDCSKADMRHGPQLSILITDYCAVDSREDLAALAHRMAQRAPAGTLTFIAEEPAVKDEAAKPASATVPQPEPKPEH